MKKIVITLTSNDPDVSNKMTDLLKANSYIAPYQLEIKPEYAFQYKEPFGQPYFENNPAYCTSVYYHFAEFSTQDQLQQFKELEAFAKGYAQHVKRVMRDSQLFTERMEKTNNVPMMELAQMGTHMKMEQLEKELKQSKPLFLDYKPSLFQSANKPSLSFTFPEAKKYSKLPYYLCGIGIALAFFAIGTPTSLALLLGCFSALLFTAGLVTAYNQGCFSGRGAFGLNP